MKLEQIMNEVIGAKLKYSEICEMELWAFEPNDLYTGKTAAKYNKLLKPFGLKVGAKQMDGYIYIGK